MRLSSKNFTKIQQCRNCKEFKTLDKFVKTTKKQAKVGVRTLCKICSNAFHKEYLKHYKAGRDVWTVEKLEERAISVDRSADKTRRHIYILKCRTETCNNTIRIRRDNKLHSGKCKPCCKRGKPYFGRYRTMFKDWRNVSVDLTYEEYLEFTKNKTCHYCEELIPWDKKQQTGYYLDRKDNDEPYSKQNCVVCCTRCNRMRSNKFTYEEFYQLSPVLKEITKQRKLLI